MFRVPFLLVAVSFFPAVLRSGDCEASYDCGGGHGAYGAIRCVCRDVPNQVQCLSCNTNNPCAGQCMECCYMNLRTGQTCCNRATCARNVWCTSGCDQLGANGLSELSRQAAAAVPGGCSVFGRKEILVSNGLTIESVESIDQLRISDPALIFDERKEIVGLEFTLENRGIETIVAHGILLELYWQGVSEPVRVSHTADGWFDDAGLPPGRSARYRASAAMKPPESGLLERVVIAADYAETKTGRAFGSDVARFGDLLRVEREIQRQVSSAVRSLAQAERDPGVLRRQIQELERRFPSTSGRIAIGRYLEFLQDGGPQEVLREALRRK